jgi:RimJ/RimL family protein N-acetyltransferase
MAEPRGAVADLVAPAGSRTLPSSEAASARAADRFDRAARETDRFDRAARETDRFDRAARETAADPEPENVAAPSPATTAMTLVVAITLVCRRGALISTLSRSRSSNRAYCRGGSLAGVSREPGSGLESEPALIVPWGERDLALLERLVGDPAMMEHLGGPETPEKIGERQRRYEDPESDCFKIVDRATGADAGWVGYWERSWHQDDVYEIGWSVIPELQGRGLAAAAAALETARAGGKRRFVHAFPSLENQPSNAICRKRGFVLLGDCELGYPPGIFMRSNDWRFDLLA